MLRNIRGSCFYFLFFWVLPAGTGSYFCLIARYYPWVSYLSSSANIHLFLCTFRLLPKDNGYGCNITDSVVPTSSTNKTRLTFFVPNVTYKAITFLFLCPLWSHTSITYRLQNIYTLFWNGMACGLTLSLLGTLFLPYMTNSRLFLFRLRRTCW